MRPPGRRRERALRVALGTLELVLVLERRGSAGGVGELERVSRPR